MLSAASRPTLTTSSHLTEQEQIFFKQNFVALGEHSAQPTPTLQSAISSKDLNLLLGLPIEVWLEISKYCPLDKWLGAVLLVNWSGFYTVGSVLFERCLPRPASTQTCAQLYDSLFGSGIKERLTQNLSANHLINHTLSGAYKRGSVSQALQNFLQGNKPRTGRDLLTWLDLPIPTGVPISTSGELIEAIDLDANELIKAIDWDANLNETQQNYIFDNLAWFMGQPKKRAPKPEIFLTLPLTVIQNGFQEAINGSEEVINDVRQITHKLMARMINSNMFIDPLNASGKPRHRESAVFSAAINSKLDWLEVLLDAGMDINNGGLQEETALQFAAEIDDLALIKFLMERGADATLVDAMGYTPLLLAARDNNIHIARYVLNFPHVVQDINRQGPLKKTALHFAVERGSEELIVSLMERGANTELKNANGDTPLMHAVKNELPIASFLAGRIADMASFLAQNYGEQTLLDKAIAESDISMIAFMIAHIGTNIAEVLTAATLKGNLQTIILLAQDMEDAFNEYKEHLLCIAAVEGRLEIATFFIEQGVAQIDNALNNALERALLSEKLSIPEKLAMARLLINKGANVNHPDNTFHLWNVIVSPNNLDIVKFLVANGAKIDWVFRGKSPLSMAIKNNDKEMVQFLVDQGAKINLPHGKLIQSSMATITNYGRIGTKINLPDRKSTRSAMAITPDYIKINAKTNLPVRQSNPLSIAMLLSGRADIFKILIQSAQFDPLSSESFELRDLARKEGIINNLSFLQNKMDEVEAKENRSALAR